MTDAFYRADLEGRIVMVSPSVVEIGGYLPEELIGERLGEFYVDKSKRSELLKRLEKGGEVVGFVAEICRKDESKAWTSISAHYWKGSDGSILGTEGDDTKYYGA